MWACSRWIFISPVPKHWCISFRWIFSKCTLRVFTWIRWWIVFKSLLSLHCSSQSLENWVFIVQDVVAAQVKQLVEILFSVRKQASAIGSSTVGHIHSSLLHLRGTALHIWNQEKAKVLRWETATRLCKIQPSRHKKIHYLLKMVQDLIAVWQLSAALIKTDSSLLDYSPDMTSRKNFPCKIPSSLN